MILRKPYAFLIKHFRIIHIILSILLAYLSIMTYRVVKFFNGYVENGYYTYSTNIAGSYINFLMYIAVIIIIGLLIFIYFLLKNKDKPRKFYIYSIIYYILLLFLLTSCYDVLRTFETSVIEVTAARFYRDFAVISFVLQIIFTIYMSIRASGFNIKKFNFKADLADLELTEKDNEEFELAVGDQSYKIKRSLRRSLREFKYYFLENKFIVVCMLIIAIGITLTIFYLNQNVYSNVYSENQTFNVNNFRLKVTSTYITNLKYNGEVLNKDKYYLILGLNIKNNLAQKSTLDISDFKIVASNNKFYYPTQSKNEHFVDLGIPYTKEEIDKNAEVDRILIYEIAKEDINLNFTFRIVNSINYKVGEIVAKYTETRLDPIIIANENQINKFNKNEEIDFNGSLLNNSKLTIINNQILNIYTYDEEVCSTKNNCFNKTLFITPKNPENRLMLMEYDLILDETIPYYYNIKNNKYFFINFMTIKYIINGNEKSFKVIDRTPNNFKDKVVIEIPYEVSNASAINAIINIRNIKYDIKLK